MRLIEPKLISPPELFFGSGLCKRSHTAANKRHCYYPYDGCAHVKPPQRLIPRIRTYGAIRQINNARPMVATKIEMLNLLIESAPPSEHFPSSIRITGGLTVPV